jgi:hypothetical protein
MLPQPPIPRSGRGQAGRGQAPAGVADGGLNPDPVRMAGRTLNVIPDLIGDPGPVQAWLDYCVSRYACVPIESGMTKEETGLLAGREGLRGSECGESSRKE